MLTYAGLVGHLDAHVSAVLPRQVMDRARSDCGGFMTPGHWTTQGGTIDGAQSLGFAWLLEGAKYYRDDEILERLILAADYGRRIRRPSGLFDLATTDWDSGPYTAFIVQAMAPVVRAARLSDAPGAADLADSWGEIIETAAPAMANGGFNTANHRWVLVGALAQSLDLFPDLDLLPIIETYLAETIDINADGEYTERSTGVYNAICNRSLRLAAEYLERDDLLEPVRMNLDTSYHLLHGDATVVTSLSRRQDRGTRVVPVGMIDSYWTMAMIDGNGFYASVADWLAGFQRAGISWSLEPFVTHPEYRTREIAREPLPKSYRKVYPTSGVYRVRKNEMSATAATGITAPFSLRYGQADLMGVKICGCYFALAQFKAEEMAAEEDGVVLKFAGHGPKDEGPVYYHPVGQPVAMEDFYEHRKTREVTVLPPLDMQLAVREVDGGFDLRLTTGEPFDNIPIQIECDFAPGGIFDFDHGAIQGKEGQTFFLKEGTGVYHVGQDAISIGPGAYAHRMWQMRNNEPAPHAFRVLVTCVTPVVDTVLEIRCGKWDEAKMQIVLSVQRHHHCMGD